MIALFGEFSLGLAVLVAAVAVLAAAAGLGLQTGPEGKGAGRLYARITRWSIVTIALLFSIASAALITALMKSQFEFVYVAQYTERALPDGYKFAAFWAGQSGSLLLWGLMLAVLCVVAVFLQGRLTAREQLISTAAMAVACGFFAVLLLFGANPFEKFPNGAPMDGNGMNPMLQDPGMIIHPPVLFLGYAGFTIPFAVLIGVLIAGRRDDRWLAVIRPWVLVSWVALTAGIVLGAWWAYVELGWGGYWAWDPVENASLLPWFTATALLHTMIIQQRKGMFRLWNASLIALSFILCIFGTFLTRSGVIQSVHAFPESWVGKLFLIFLGLLTVFSLGLFIVRWRLLRADHQLESFISREGAFLLGTILLTIMMLTTLIGTIFPILSEPFGNPITVKAPFYNKVVAPMGLLLAFIMAHGPVLAYGRSAAGRIARDMVIPGVVGLIAVALMAIGWTRNPWALACTFVAVLGTLAVLVAFARTVTARHQSTGESWLMASIRLIDGDKRRYGAQVTHLGVMMIIMGVTGSSLFGSEHNVVLDVEEPKQLDDMTITLTSIDQFFETNYMALQATVTLADAEGSAITLYPQKRLYNKWQQQVNTEVALHSTLGRDVYFILGGVNDEGTSAGLQVLIFPVVIWIWLGGCVMSLGGIFCMLPRFLPQTRPVEETQPSSAESVGESISGVSNLEAESPA